jgi:hypothetical protein
MTTSNNGTKSRAVDTAMERASQALVATDYFEAEKQCVKALHLARTAHDFERMARICLPLQEARRQRRLAACDVPGCVVLREMPAEDEALVPGRYLIEPPLVGVRARELRLLAQMRRVPIAVLAREPQTKAGKWPIVGVGTGPREAVVVRAYVDPPDSGDVSLPWFMAAQEALGDAAIMKAPVGVPADHHVDDMLDLLEAAPDHERLIQEVARACRDAFGTVPTTLPRRRPIVEDAFSF